MNEVQHTARVLGLIPARGGSKGVPRKNIHDLGGSPLIVHTIRAAQESARLTDVVVSTDSEEIASIARGAGVDVPWLRPAELAADDSRAQDAALHALSHAPGADYDYLLLLQPTTPFRSGADIDAAIELALKHDATSVIGFAEEETKHPYYMYRYESGEPDRVEQLMEYEVGLPRQEFPSCVYRNGAIYLVKVSHLREHHAFVSDDTVPYLMPPERSVNIDTPEDLLYATFLLERGLAKAP